MEKLRGFSQITLIIVVAVAAVVVVAFYLKQHNRLPAAGSHLSLGSTSTQSGPPQSLSDQASVPAVNSPQDLATVSNDLDTTDIDSLNTQISQNDSGAANF